MTVQASRTTSILSPIEVVRAYVSAFGAGDIDQAVDLLHEDVIWHVDGDPSVPTIGYRQGRKQARQWLRSFPDGFTPKHFAIERFLSDGEDVVALGRFRHLVRPADRTVEGDFAIRFQVRDGLIARYQILEDSLALYRAFEKAYPWHDQSLRINGTIYAYTDIGEGPTLFFAHGLFADRSMFASQIEELSKSYRCIAVDMPGHGKSGYDPKGWTLDGIAHDIALMISELKLGRVCFVGQSQGGMVGLRLAMSHSALVSKLVLIGTTARAELADRIPAWHALRQTILIGTIAERENAFKELQTRVNSREWLRQNPRSALKDRERMMSHSQEGLALAIDAAVFNRADIMGSMGEIAAPTLIVCGDQDKATPLSLSEEMAAALPNARFSLLRCAAHHPPLEAPQEVLAEIHGFVSEMSRVE